MRTDVIAMMVEADGINKKNIQRTSKKRCFVCGMRKRGANHDNGSHHKLHAAKK